MFTKRLTFIILGTFLIISGLMNFISGLSSLSIIIPIFALVTGIVILVVTPGISSFIGWIIFSVYLIARGGTVIFNFSFPGLSTVLAVLALAAGLLLIVRTPGFKHHIGFLLLCVWLILIGLAGLVTIGEVEMIIAGLAIVSGIFLILNE